MSVSRPLALSSSCCGSRTWGGFPCAGGTDAFGTGLLPSVVLTSLYWRWRLRRRGRFLHGLRQQGDSGRPDYGRRGPLRVDHPLEQPQFCLPLFFVTERASLSVLETVLCKGAGQTSCVTLALFQSARPILARQASTYGVPDASAEEAVLSNVRFDFFFFLATATDTHPWQQWTVLRDYARNVLLICGRFIRHYRWWCHSRCDVFCCFRRFLLACWVGTPRYVLHCRLMLFLLRVVQKAAYGILETRLGVNIFEISTAVRQDKIGVGGLWRKRQHNQEVVFCVRVRVCVRSCVKLRARRTSSRVLTSLAFVAFSGINY